jgi:hypothetical protein
MRNGISWSRYFGGLPAACGLIIDVTGYFVSFAAKPRKQNEGCSPGPG